jgi:hypothetical protein
MSPFIEHATLAEGFNKAIPFIKSIGMEMEVACVGLHMSSVMCIIQLQGANLL